MTNANELEQLARLAYAAYGLVVHYKNHAGQPMPEFDDLPERTRNAWVAAAETARVTGILAQRPGPDERMPPHDWMTSTRLTRLLAAHRENDVKVDIRGTLVPIAALNYDFSADCLVLELVDGEDLAIAIDPWPHDADDEP